VELYIHSAILIIQWYKTVVFITLDNQYIVIDHILNIANINIYMM